MKYTHPYIYIYIPDSAMTEQVTEQASASTEGIVNMDEPKKMTREDWRKKKELEEQRKLGNAPAEVDEEGKYVNFETKDNEIDQVVVDPKTNSSYYYFF